MGIKAGRRRWTRGQLLRGLGEDGVIVCVVGWDGDKVRVVHGLDPSMDWMVLDGSIRCDLNGLDLKNGPMSNSGPSHSLTQGIRDLKANI